MNTYKKRRGKKKKEEKKKVQSKSRVVVQNVSVQTTAHYGDREGEESQFTGELLLRVEGEG